MVQLVECLLAKEKVTGSSPVARSKYCKQHDSVACICLIWRRGQVARQGSAKPLSWVQIPSSPLLPELTPLSLVSIEVQAHPIVASSSRTNSPFIGLPSRYRHIPSSPLLPELTPLSLVYHRGTGTSHRRLFFPN